MARNIGRLEQMLRRKLVAGLSSAAEALAERYSQDVDIPVEVITPLHIVRSQPGEYPRKETGRGQANIGWGIDVARLRSGVGVRPPGEHLAELGTEKWQRKYIDDTLFENLDEIRKAFIDGANRA